jgi:hypothetical protein
MEYTTGMWRRAAAIAGAGILGWVQAKWAAFRLGPDCHGFAGPLEEPAAILLSVLLVVAVALAAFWRERRGPGSRGACSSDSS